MPYAQVCALTDDQAIEHFDRVAKHTTDSLSFWRDELFRRAEAAQTRSMLRLTWYIAGMTVVMTAATVVNVVLFALS